MKLLCKVHGKPAVIVGYGPGRKGKVRAIVVVEGKLKDVGFKDIQLEGFEKSLPDNVENIPPRKKA